MENARETKAILDTVRQSLETAREIVPVDLADELQVRGAISGNDFSEIEMAREQLEIALGRLEEAEGGDAD